MSIPLPQARLGAAEWSPAREMLSKNPLGKRKNKNKRGLKEINQVKKNRKEKKVENNKLRFDAVW